MILCLFKPFFSLLLREVRNCNICAKYLPFCPRPVIWLHARILIVGQVPGRNVHESGIPFADISGNRL
jgi:uracil-DNA glycosylase